MWDAAAELAAALEHALGSFTEALAGVSIGWLVLGVVLHLANQVARGRGWCTLLRAASGEDVRRRDAVAAWVAGAGAGGLASARARRCGARALLLRRRVPDCPLLAGTIVAEGAGELLVGAALLAVAVSAGLGPEFGAPGLIWIVPAVIGVALIVLVVARTPRLRAIAARRRPRLRAAQAARGAYARGVLPWQIASRACRLGALACFLAAFGLPATFAAVLLVDRRAERRPARPVRARLGRRRRRDARRHLRARHRHRGAGRRSSPPSSSARAWC